MSQFTDQDLSHGAIAVCGDRVKHYRKRLGWTQEELAQHSGYSDRLIRKAEGSRSLSYQTIQDLAQSLSCEEITVTLDDLICSPKKSLQRFLDFGSTEQHDIRSLQEITSADCRLEFLGDTRVPLTGVWVGVEGCFLWLTLFRERIGKKKTVEDTVMAVEGEHGFMHMAFAIREKGYVRDQLDLVMHTRFQVGKICHVQVLSDSRKLEQFFQLDRS